MASYVETNCRTFLAGEAMEQFARVKLVAGKIVKAGADELGIGTVEAPVLAADQACPVRLWNANGTRKMVAAGAFALGAEVYGAASGRIDDVTTLANIGVALAAAGDAGSIVEVAPLPVQNAGS